MGYTKLKDIFDRTENNIEFTFEEAVLRFIREDCEGLRFDEKKEKEETENGVYLGTSLKENQIPYNMQMDIDRLCLENALARFLKSGKKEDAFDVYFCYLEMFVGDYEKTRRMIELLSEYEANGSRLLMKHRDHYSHSVYVFALGLAIYGSNEIYRKEYQKYYELDKAGQEHKAACHYLKYWGLTSLFHDIGYPFELPFEQVCSYFEVQDEKRKEHPFVSYQTLASLTRVDRRGRKDLFKIYNRNFATTNELFAHVLYEKLGKKGYYTFTEEEMQQSLEDKPARPEAFNYFMDHAYFSATVLFQKMFGELKCTLEPEHLDALTAILMHNSLYKFSIAFYKEKENHPFEAKFHPLAYMLMLCDELQCWDRTAYGRNSRKELHPMGCEFDFSGNGIKAVYLFDRKESGKVELFEERYGKYLDEKKRDPEKEPPKLKAYSSMHTREDGSSDFQEDIKRIVDLHGIKFSVETKQAQKERSERRNYLSDSSYLNLHNFAVVLNGRWNNAEWKKAKEKKQEEEFLGDKNVREEFSRSFQKLSLEYKLSNINQAKAFAYYMNKIGCFYTDKEVDFEVVESFGEEELEIIGKLEHRRWLQDHYDMGWDYGEPKKEERELVRKHIDMIPGFDLKQKKVSVEQAEENYRRLDKEEQDKDKDPMECMLALLRMFDGLRIYRLE